MDNEFSSIPSFPPACGCREGAWVGEFQGVSDVETSLGPQERIFSLPVESLFDSEFFSKLSMLPPHVFGKDELAVSQA